MRKAIVIDDVKDNAEVFAEYLRFSGFDVLGIGHDGKSAVELYLDLRPEIVFLDVMMPRYDGFYGLEMIKNAEPSAKVIMMTADVSETTKNQLLELGADYVLCKPFEIEEIRLVLQRLFEVPSL